MEVLVSLCVWKGKWKGNENEGKWKGNENEGKWKVNERERGN